MKKESTKIIVKDILVIILTLICAIVPLLLVDGLFEIKEFEIKRTIGYLLLVLAIVFFVVSIILTIKENARFIDNFVFTGKYPLLLTIFPGLCLISNVNMGSSFFSSNILVMIILEAIRKKLVEKGILQNKISLILYLIAIVLTSIVIFIFRMSKYSKMGY